MSKSIPMSATRAPSGREAESAIAAFRDAGGSTDPEALRVVGLMGEHAPSLVPLAVADPSLLDDILDGSLSLHLPWTATHLRQRLLAESRADEDAIKQRLRACRHRAIVRIALREILRLADVRQSAAETATLAEVIVDAALTAAMRFVGQRHGFPRFSDGRIVPLVCLGMGKLSGAELNLGSDIDLCFFHESDEAEVDGSDQTVQELYSRVVRTCVRILSDFTDHGFCFRVDLRLRPEGARGPLTNDLASAERYYESWGQTWERAALLRSRPVAGDLAFGARLLETLRPFVFRRQVDPTIADVMANMVARSRREADVADGRNVKLGRGGIREAEFFVQSLQLIWGGRYPELQVPGTMEGLARLKACGLVTDRDAQTLAEGWTLLRQVEHRIHVWTGYQTHDVPEDPGVLHRFALSLGFADGEQFSTRLSAARGEIAKLFDSLRPEQVPSPAAPEPDPWVLILDWVAAGETADHLVQPLSAQLPLAEPYASATHLVRLGRRPSDPLGTVTRERLPAFGRLLARELEQAADPDLALQYLADFFARTGGNWPYEKLLVERPRLTRRLVGLFGSSGTLAASLVGHPEDVDRLLSASLAPDADQLAEMHADLPRLHDADPDLFLGELRRLKRVVTLQSGLGYAGGDRPLGETCATLSALADHQIRAAFAAACRWAERRWGSPPPDAGAAVCALGKLGGHELGFGGDLDLMFLYRGDGATERGGDRAGVSLAEWFTRVAQRTMLLLRQPHGAGPGYETDTRLRPSGAQGTLVVSQSAFDAYHQRHAAAWERQTLVRARPVAGHPGAMAEAGRRLEHWAYAAGAPDAVEIAQIRGRMQHELARETLGQYHLKLGFGGLVDVEFLVQWLQMRHGSDPRVRTPNTLRAVEALTEASVLDPQDAETLTEAYRFLRNAEQALKLYDEQREPVVNPGSRTGAYLSRALGVFARDGHAPARVLERTLLTHTRSVRACFERTLAKVPASPTASGP